MKDLVTVYLNSKSKQFYLFYTLIFHSRSFHGTVKTFNAWHDEGFRLKDEVTSTPEKAWFTEEGKILYAFQHAKVKFQAEREK